MILFLHFSLSAISNPLITNADTKTDLTQLRNNDICIIISIEIPQVLEPLLSTALEMQFPGGEKSYSQWLQPPDMLNGCSRPEGTTFFVISNTGSVRSTVLTYKDICLKKGMQRFDC